MGKTRGIFKKIGNIKGTFHPKMSTIKDRNGKDLIEPEEIKKRWKEYTEELYKNDLNNPESRDGVVTHQEPDILECEKSRTRLSDWTELNWNLLTFIYKT